MPGIDVVKVRKLLNGSFVLLLIIIFINGIVDRAAAIVVCLDVIE